MGIYTTTGVGAPTIGSFGAADMVVDSVGRVFICIASGSPGNWIMLGVDPTILTAGEEIISRTTAAANAALTSQRMELSYFTARKSQTITKLMVSVETTAAVTVTFGGLALYSIASNGNGTLVASTASDVAGFGPINTFYTPTLQTSYNVVAGQFYAAAILCVATTMPLLTARPGNANFFSNQTPRLTGAITGQLTFPATFTAASVVTSGNLFYVAMKP